MSTTAGYQRPQAHIQNVYYCWIPKATNTHSEYVVLLDTKGLKHTLRIRSSVGYLRLQNTHTLCNIYCFSTTTVFARTPLNVTLYVHCLPCYHFSRTQRACRSAFVMLLVRGYMLLRNGFRDPSRLHITLILRCINGAADKPYFNMWIRHFLLCHIGIERKGPLGKPRRRRGG